jgi:hypothetical protein
VLRIAEARLRLIIRPTERYCPAPSEIGLVTFSGSRGAQVPMESSAACSANRLLTASSSTL